MPRPIPTPVKPPVHNYQFALNGEKVDTALTFEQALGLARMSMYHRRDHKVHRDTDIYAVASYPGGMLVQVLGVGKVVYALMHEYTFGSNNGNELWTANQIRDIVKRVQGRLGHDTDKLAQYRCSILLDYAKNNK